MMTYGNNYKKDMEHNGSGVIACSNARLWR